MNKNHKEISEKKEVVIKLKSCIITKENIYKFWDKLNPKIYKQF